MSYLLYFVAIVAAEAATVFFSPLAGIAFHSVVLISLLLHSALTLKQPTHRFFLSLALAPLIRILSLSLPLTPFAQIYWYLIISIPLTAAGFVIMRLLNFKRGEVGFSWGRWRPQLALGVTGLAFGGVEYLILRPQPLASSLSPAALFFPMLILLVSTGFAEEFIFRGVMQRASQEALGQWGVIYVSLVFTSMHMGYLSVVDLVFVFAVALFFSWAVKRTGSLLGVTLAHGIINIMLFLVFPFFSTSV